MRKVLLLCLVAFGSNTGVIVSNANAQKADLVKKEPEILLYLPIHQEQFPQLVQQLKSELDNSGLHHLKIVTTEYWHPYQNGIRQGRPGIYFTAPHFSAWLVNKHKFTPLLRLAGQLQYVIAARRSDSDIFEVGDLANKTVCTNATMDLSFLLVRESMTRSVLSAQTKNVQNVAREMSNNNRACDAFSLSEHLFLEFAVQEPFRFIRLQQSETFSNYAYLFSPNISSSIRVRVKKVLTSKKVNTILHPMYRLYAQEPIITNGSPNNYPPEQMKPLNIYWGATRIKAL